jgi:mannose-6-phosphate isomerase
MNSKDEVIEQVNQIIANHDFLVTDSDLTRPWGAFFRLDNKEAERFIDIYFADIKNSFKSFNSLSPKFLIVEPGQRLSWQYHYRRAELWRVLKGPVGIKLSTNDTEPKAAATLAINDLVQFPALKRHRLIGLKYWGIVVEIWQHTDNNNLSDESDIVRVSDDFGR